MPDGFYFTLRVSDRGRITFNLIYRRDGKPTRHKLGVYGKVRGRLTLLMARKAALDAAEKIMDGWDPVGEKKKAKEEEEEKRIEEEGIPTFKQLARDFLNNYVEVYKKDHVQDHSAMKVFISEFGDRKFNDISRFEMQDFLKEKAKKTPVRANRLLATIHKCYNWSRNETKYGSILPYNPFTGLEKPGVEKERERVLSPREIREVWEKLSATPYSDFFKLLFLTDQRVGEVRMMRWKDIEDNIWTIPAEFSKNGRDHRVPLTKPVMNILSRIPKESDWVFPGKRDKEVAYIVVYYEFKKAVKDIPDFNMHDIRRTSGTLITGGGIPRLVMYRAQNHVEGGIGKVYDRHSYDNEKLEALELVADRLREIIGPEFDSTPKPVPKSAKVVTLRQ